MWILRHVFTCTTFWSCTLFGCLHHFTPTERTLPRWRSVCRSSVWKRSRADLNWFLDDGFSLTWFWTWTFGAAAPDVPEGITTPPETGPQGSQRPCDYSDWKSVKVKLRGTKRNCFHGKWFSQTSCQQLQLFEIQAINPSTLLCVVTKHKSAAETLWSLVLVAPSGPQNINFQQFSFIFSEVFKNNNYSLHYKRFSSQT